MPCFSISRTHSSRCVAGGTVMGCGVITSETRIQAGHLFSAATLSEISLCDMTPTQLAAGLEHAYRAHLLFAQVTRRIVDGHVFGDGIDFGSRADQIFDLHVSPPHSVESRAILCRNGGIAT